MSEPREISIEFPPEYFDALKLVPQRLAKRMRIGLFRYMRSFVDSNGQWQRANITSGRPGLHRRSGALNKSFAALDVSTGEGIGDAASLAFTTSKYARIHEFGGTILPKRGKYLVWEAKGTGRRGKTTKVFARSVTIPPRMRFFESFQKDTGGRSIMLRAAVAEALGMPMGPGVKFGKADPHGPALPPGMSP